MEVLSATEFLIECVGRTVAEGLTFMDLVHNDEKNNCRAAPGAGLVCFSLVVWVFLMSF